MVKTKKRKRKYTPALKKAQNKYNQKAKTIGIRFKENEIDLYNFVHGKKNYSSFIKDLIRDYIKNNNDSFN